MKRKIFYSFACIITTFFLFISLKINAGLLHQKEISNFSIEEPVVSYDNYYGMFTASWSWAGGDFPPPYRIEIYTVGEFPYHSEYTLYDKYITRYLMLPTGEYIHVKLTSEIYFVSTSTLFYNP